MFEDNCLGGLVHRILSGSSFSRLKFFSSTNGSNFCDMLQDFVCVYLMKAGMDTDHF